MLIASARFVNQLRNKPRHHLFMRPYLNSWRNARLFGELRRCGRQVQHPGVGGSWTGW